MTEERRISRRRRKEGSGYDSCLEATRRGQSIGNNGYGAAGKVDIERSRKARGL
ncbi:hypothetical protein HPP92_021470 [Vanilla planifolia]|uniref:Uncharacterized protein n=1 Tax=Vanilla planifolia TaxID=51239 RepID=A0A835PZW9_VANPL|nr:hypothetical protein HPP92_021470 [Vanilla planifolia]